MGCHLTFTYQLLPMTYNPSPMTQTPKKTEIRIDDHLSAIAHLNFFFSFNGIETDGKFLVPRTHYFVQFLKLKILSEF